MNSQPIALPEHPVVDLAHRLHCRLKALAQAPLLSMTPEQKRDALVSLTQNLAQLEALRLRVLAEAEHSEVTVESGAPTAADWLAVETRQVRRDARADLKLAQQLEGHPFLSAAMSAGRVNTAQARAIVATLDRLPRSGSSRPPRTTRRRGGSPRRARGGA